MGCLGVGISDKGSGLCKGMLSVLRLCRICFSHCRPLRAKQRKWRAKGGVVFWRKIVCFSSLKHYIIFQIFTVCALLIWKVLTTILFCFHKFIITFSTLDNRGIFFTFFILCVIFVISKCNIIHIFLLYFFRKREVWQRTASDSAWAPGMLVFFFNI